MRAENALTDEALEIIRNIEECVELSYQQRKELLDLVFTDVREKLELARGLLDAWRRDEFHSDNMAV